MRRPFPKGKTPFPVEIIGPVPQPPNSSKVIFSSTSASEGVLKVILVNPSEPQKSEASKLNRKWLNNFLIEVILEHKILKSLLF